MAFSLNSFVASNSSQGGVSHGYNMKAYAGVVQVFATPSPGNFQFVAIPSTNIGLAASFTYAGHGFNDWQGRIYGYCDT